MVLERLPRSLSRQVGSAIAVIEARVAPEGFDAATFGDGARLPLRPSPVRLARSAVCGSRRGTCRVSSILPRCASGPTPSSASTILPPFAGAGPASPGRSRGACLSSSWGPVEGDERMWRFRIEANAFCHQMVRSIVGTLVAVGQDRVRAGEMLAILRSGERSSGAQPAPPQGLCLARVRYPANLVPGGAGSQAPVTGREAACRGLRGPLSKLLAWPVELELRAQILARPVACARGTQHRASLVGTDKGRTVRTYSPKPS